MRVEAEKCRLNNRCISGVCGWDFNLITSKVFVSCVRQLNTLTEYATFFQNSLRELTVSPNKSVSRRCNYVDADHIKSTNTWGRVSQILR